MAGLDLSGADKAVKRINSETIPAFRELIGDVLAEVGSIRKLLDGAKITITIVIEGGKNAKNSDAPGSAPAMEPSHVRPSE